ncbi:NAD(P)-binding protein [Streptomyces sp. G-G2]|uniref:NAD(P)/FAD-dependent oxidoreductase n=1 Tax=Streptomyces sp. G-G2 TaxID=3046201 RepID=UPI0024B9D909|nr:NAD(P)-binding protein [Streptomyces sp. G-G2]MDJ0385187.1 monooxygenase [Streptomyces sp. G-G2]
MGNRTRTRGDRWGTAVVVGGGHAGLVTARVLADHFREVVVLERDPVDADTGVHPHAPQGYHAHAVLAKGSQVLEALFPGLRAELEEIGAPVFDYGERIDFLLPAGLAPRGPTGVRVQSFTRDALERRLRRRVMALPEVRILSGAHCEGLAPGRPGSVGLVRYRVSGGDGAAEGVTGEVTELAADLVVDASGRAGGLDGRLAGLGVPAPGKRVVKAKITYTSMSFDRPEKNPADFDVAYQMTFAPGIARGGVILAVEHGRWMCSLFGYGDQVPPTDDAGYLDFARGLGNPHLAGQIEQRDRPETVHRYVNTNNQWNLYHQSKRWPERLLAVGDSVCVFNPVYGQGLTVAAMEAELLQGMLAALRAEGGGLDGLSRTFQNRVARLLIAPWTLSSNSDLMWNPDDRPLPARIAHWYNTHLFAVSVRDPEVWARFVGVVNMVAPPTALFHPSVLRKVLVQALSKRRTRPPAHRAP